MLGHAARFPLQWPRHSFSNSWSVASWWLITEFNPGLGSPQVITLPQASPSPCGQLPPNGSMQTLLTGIGTLVKGHPTFRTLMGLLRPLQQATSNRPLLPFLPYWCCIGEQFPINHPYANLCLRSASEGPDLQDGGLSEWKLLIECPRLFTKTNCPAIHMGYWFDGLLFCEDTSWA